MKFNDDITLSIADTVKDVLEGKATVKKEEVKYPHMMYDPKTGEGVEVKDKAEHDKYSKMGWGHEKPKNLDEVEEPNVPSKDANMGSKKGEAEFKKLHKGKKVGEKEDGTVVKEYTINVPLNEETIDVDYIGDKDLSKKLEKKFKVKIKDTGSTTADITGTKANLIKLLKSDAYLMDDDEINDVFPELKEGKEVDEESEKQAAYKKVFNAGLKKFGVNGIGELDDEKKKEFFNWVDKNYEAKAEELDSKKVDDEEEVNEAVISTPFSSDEMKNTGGDKAAKKMGVKVKVQKGKGDGLYGEDNGIFTGSEQALVRYFKDYFGFEGNNFRELKKEFHK